MSVFYTHAVSGEKVWRLDEDVGFYPLDCEEVVERCRREHAAVVPIQAAWRGVLSR